MTYKEKILYLILWGFIIISLSAGFLPSVETETNYAEPNIYDKVYFVLVQVSEILLLCGLYTVITHYKLIYLLRGLILLSLSELIDDLLGVNIFGVTIVDIALVVAVFYVVYKQIEHVRHKRLKNGVE